VAQGPASVYIKNARFLLTMDPQRRLLENVSVAVAGDSIAAIGADSELADEWVGQDTKVIDASEMFVTPGLVNSHIHLESCYDKGLLDDLPVVPWCERYFSYTYGTLTDESYYYAAMMSLLACLKTGTTTVCDCGTIQTMEDSAARALTDIGMRGILGRDLMDIHAASKGDYVSYDAFTDLLDRLQESTEQCLERSEKFINDYHDTTDGRIKAWMDLQQVCNCSPELCQGVVKLADEYGVGILTHAGVSHDMVEMTRKRFGQRDIEYLHAQGVTGPNFLAAHMAWVDAAELIQLGDRLQRRPRPGVVAARRLLGRVGAGQDHEYVRAGINVAIGNDESSTGTCPTSSATSTWCRRPMPSATRCCSPTATCSCSSRPRRTPWPSRWRPSTAPKREWEDDIGSIEVGKKADITTWDLNSYEWIPTTRQNLLNNFVYNGTGRSAHTVLCNGDVIMEGQKILTIDEAEIRGKAQAFGEQYIPTAPWLKDPECGSSSGCVNRGGAGVAGVAALDTTTVRAVGVRPAATVCPEVGPRRYLHSGPRSRSPTWSAGRGALAGRWCSRARRPTWPRPSAWLPGARSRSFPARPSAPPAPWPGSSPADAGRGRRGRRWGADLCPAERGLGRALRFGSYDDDILARLRWMRDVAAPLLDEAIDDVEGVDVTGLQSEGLGAG
jgi:5-methylthioadenosine/S-adenosylhomocysteine deaminase